MLLFLDPIWGEDNADELFIFTLSENGHHHPPDSTTEFALVTN